MRVRTTSARLLVLLLATLLGCERSPTTGSSGGELAWLQQNGVTFRTAEPGGDYADLMPLRQIVGDARVVALGEATHGTREFFRMKHRLLEFLVREMGFNTFAIEATWAEANRINDYVHTGVGDPEVLLSNLYFWTWNTQEVLAMIRWMRQHNQNPGNAPRVSFFGFDMQFSRVTMDEVEAYLERVDPAALEEVRRRFGCYRAFQDRIGQPSPNYAQAPPSVQEECRTNVQAVHTLLSDNRAVYEQRSSAQEYARALRAARIVVQNEVMRAGGGGAARDEFMAENAIWLLDQAGPQGKIVLWAHNFHIHDLHPWMGAHLRQRYGADYLIAGFSFYQGGFNAVEQSLSGTFLGLRALSAPPAVSRSYEEYFQRLGQPRVLFDLRPLRANPPPAAAWLRGPLPLRNIGAVYRPGNPGAYYTSTPLPAQYDVIIHFENTTPSALLPFRFQ